MFATVGFEVGSSRKFDLCSRLCGRVWLLLFVLLSSPLPITLFSCLSSLFHFPSLPFLPSAVLVAQDRLPSSSFWSYCLSFPFSSSSLVPPLLPLALACFLSCSLAWLYACLHVGLCVGMPICLYVDCNVNAFLDKILSTVRCFSSASLCVCQLFNVRAFMPTCFPVYVVAKVLVCCSSCLLV